MTKISGEMTRFPGDTTSGEMTNGRLKQKPPCLLLKMRCLVLLGIIYVNLTPVQKAGFYHKRHLKPSVFNPNSVTCH